MKAVCAFQVVPGDMRSWDAPKKADAGSLRFVLVYGFYRNCPALCRSLGGSLHLTFQALSFRLRTRMIIFLRSSSASFWAPSGTMS